MKCKKCGLENQHPRLYPVYPPAPSLVKMNRSKPSLEVAYSFWACDGCRTCHFQDGTLYKDPFKEDHK
jgi:hypothetical protein